METIKNNTLNRLLRFLENQEQFVFLDTSKAVTGNSRSLVFLNPVDRLKFVDGDDEIEFLQKVQNYQDNGLYVAGWISYEFGYLLENSLRGYLNRKEDRGALLADLGVFPKPHFFDHTNGTTDFPLDENILDEQSWEVADLSMSQKREEYIEAIKSVLEYIKAGDTYQVNYTLKLLFNFMGSPESFYRDLRRNQSVAYGAYIRWGEERVLSFSPELFFKKSGNKVQVQPMKGTMKRGRTLSEDLKNKEFLAGDIKNRSENVMIVDLLRNDLGRLMHYVADGDVKVDSLFDVESFETLLQMTSTITGVAAGDSLDELSLVNFFKAIFPCGSVTGAPKIRTMEIINELEKSRRGVYTGAIGYLSPTGEAVFSVPIRTISLHGSKGEMGIGSGIVFDSEPEDEWWECLLKARFLTHPQEEFELFETLLWQPQKGYWQLEKHLKRLSDSANYFLFSFNIEEIRNALLEQGRAAGEKTMRIRLSLSKDASLELTAFECDTPGWLSLPEKPVASCENFPVFTFSLESTDSSDVRLYHKSTRRELYNLEYQKAQKGGFFDFCFCNEEGEVTEGCITNIIIWEDGTYYTPPLTSGLLPGIMREHLLEDKIRPLVERVLTKDDVRRAEAVFLTNSVRGVVQVKLME